MASSSTLIALLFSLALFASVIEARKGFSGDIWKRGTDIQPLLEAIQHRRHGDSSLMADSRNIDLGKAAIASNEEETSHFVNFDPRPNLSSYNDESEFKEFQKTFVADFIDRKVTNSADAIVTKAEA